MSTTKISQVLDGHNFDDGVLIMDQEGRIFTAVICEPLIMHKDMSEGELAETMSYLPAVVLRPSQLLCTASGEIDRATQGGDYESE